MALHTVTRRCGHVEDVQIYGPEKGRPAKARAEEQRDCWSCTRAVQDDRARAAADRLDLPPLEDGTDKQIGYATTVRGRAVDRLGPLASLQHLRAALDQLTSARKWLDNKDYAVEYVVEAAGPCEADPAHHEEYTRHLLDLDTDFRLDDPAWRPGRGTSRPAPVLLTGPAAKAMRLWAAVSSQRALNRGRPVLPSLDRATAMLPRVPPLHALMRPEIVPAVVHRWLAGHEATPAGAAVRAAWEDALTRDPVDEHRLGHAEWLFAPSLIGYNTPVERVVFDTDTRTMCSHGVSYADPCEGCGP